MPIAVRRCEAGDSATPLCFSQDLAFAPMNELKTTRKERAFWRAQRHERLDLRRGPSMKPQPGTDQGLVCSVSDAIVQAKQNSLALSIFRRPFRQLDHGLGCCGGIVASLPGVGPARLAQFDVCSHRGTGCSRPPLPTPRAQPSSGGALGPVFCVGSRHHRLSMGSLGVCHLHDR